jgi:hypothetical protein
MLKIRVLGTGKVMSSLEREKEKFIDLVAKDIKDVAVRRTPIDKGRARRGWRLEGTGTGKRIVNRVPYIDVLEKGHSKQAPNGILGPTVREISQRRYKL